MRVRCRHCGFVRAKNTTRQVEHLSTCREFLTSAEGQQVVNSGGLMLSETEGTDIWRGGAPNPNLAGMINRRGPNSKPRASGGGGGGGGAQQMPSRTAPRPSLASHLISRMGTTLTDATQRPFLSHAGCGTLSAAALNQWLAQEIHISRALVPFVGQLIGKTRIPETSDLTHDPTYRALDLLCSAVNNMKKELEFLEATKRKYNLNVDIEDPHAATQGFMDLFASASSPQSSLLEGLVVLWATEHVGRCLWLYEQQTPANAVPVLLHLVPVCCEFHLDHAGFFQLPAAVLPDAWHHGRGQHVREPEP